MKMWFVVVWGDKVAPQTNATKSQERFTNAILITEFNPSLNLVTGSKNDHASAHPIKVNLERVTYNRLRKRLFTGCN